MQKFNAPVKRNHDIPSSVLPDWPMHCMDKNCEGGFDSDHPEQKLSYSMQDRRQPLIVFVQVSDDRNRVLTGGAGKYVKFDHHGNFTNELKHGYSFIRWITRCNKCHMKALDNAKRSVNTKRGVSEAA